MPPPPPCWGTWSERLLIVGADNWIDGFGCTCVIMKRSLLSTRQIGSRVMPWTTLYPTRSPPSGLTPPALPPSCPPPDFTS